MQLIMKKYTEPNIEVIELNTEGQDIMTVSSIAVDPNQSVDEGRVSRRRSDSWSDYDR
jgi:hypothetical protein